MTLINIVGLTATNETFLCGQALLAHEDTTDYVWLLKWLKKLYITREIPLPSSITSDKESGLLPALKQVFPETAHLLCVWHVNTDIKKWCLKHYRKEADTLH
jgi:transposase-like protein